MKSGPVSSSQCEERFCWANPASAMEIKAANTTRKLRMNFTLNPRSNLEHAHHSTRYGQIRGTGLLCGTVGERVLHRPDALVLSKQPKLIDGLDLAHPALEHWHLWRHQPADRSRS